MLYVFDEEDSPELMMMMVDSSNSMNMSLWIVGYSIEHSLMMTLFDCYSSHLIMLVVNSYQMEVSVVLMVHIHDYYTYSWMLIH
jgi:hypothetical protein